MVWLNFHFVHQNKKDINKAVHQYFFLTIFEQNPKGLCHDKILQAIFFMVTIVMLLLYRVVYLKL